MTPSVTVSDGGAADRHVLADRGDHLGHEFGNRMRGAGIHGLELLGVAASLERQLRDLGDHGLELLVAGDEVGLRVHLDDGGPWCPDGDADEAFGGDARRLLGGLGEALGAQPVDGGFHVATGGGERRLAIHHAYAGLLAQVLHHGSGNVISAIIHLFEFDHRLLRMRIRARAFNAAGPVSDLVDGRGASPSGGRHFFGLDRLLGGADVHAPSPTGRARCRRCRRG
jgi:hypothetical protein